MREIKFRAKSLSGVWEYGELHIKNCRIPHIHTDIRSTINIDPNTVGQFTGLYDKNGREIYEGDILRKCTHFESDLIETYLDRDTIGVVRILPSCGTTICNCIAYEKDNPCAEKKKKKERIKRTQVVGKRCEIIGNIYDNPELMEANQ